MIKENLAFIDVETTGLEVGKHEVIEVGCVLVSQELGSKEPSFSVIDEFELKIKPKRIEIADPVALKVNKYDPANWVFAHELSEAMKVFASRTEGFVMVAHNVIFDHSFLEQAFKDTGLENKMHFHRLDTLSMAFAKLARVEDVDHLSLGYLANYFNIENKNPHTALADARTTFELYKKLMTL